MIKLGHFFNLKVLENSHGQTKAEANRRGSRKATGKGNDGAKQSVVSINIFDANYFIYFFNVLNKNTFNDFFKKGGK
jgi:hypothetical protein